MDTIKNHAQLVGAIVALFMILATGWFFIHSGMHEGTLLGALIMGAVQIGQQIAGLKPATLPLGSAPPQQPQIPQLPQLPQQPPTQAAPTPEAPPPA